MPVESEYMQAGEKIVRVIHRHWINVFPVFVAMAVVFLLDLYGFYRLGRFGSPAPHTFSDQIFAVFLVAVLILVALITLLAVVVFLRNRLILTDKRMIQVTLNGLLNETVSQLTLDHVQDVKAGQHGFFPQVLDYGDVEVETAGEVDNFVFRQAPDPNSICAFIIRLHEQSDVHPDDDSNVTPTE
jgi:uncharacterized membrane protein YdbT with pleckstrin-like domain